MRYAYVALIILLFKVTHVYAGREPGDFQLAQFTTENGLPQNSVKAIACDDLGFYWLATEAGIVRFDGRNFRFFDKAKTGISSNRFFNILKDGSSGKLLGIADKGAVLVIDKGIAVLSPKGIKEYFSMLGNASGSRTYLRQTWQFDQERYFNFDQDSTFLPVSRNKGILMTRGWICWFLSGKKIAAYPIPGTFAFERVFHIGEHIYTFISEGGQLKVQQITPGGMAPLKLTGDILLQKDRLPPVVCENDAAGQTFIASGNCFYLVEINASGDLHTTLLLSGFDFAKRMVAAACYDKKLDILLLGSRVDGLYVFKRKTFQTRTIRDLAGSYNVVQDQVVYNDSSILTDKGIICSTGKPDAYFLPQARSKMAYSGSRIMKTEKSIWAISGNMLYRYSPDFKTLIRKWPLAFEVSELAEVQGRLWLAGYKDQVFQLDYQSPLNTLKLVCNMKAHVQTMKAYKEHVWIGTNAGLFRYDLRDHKITSLELFRGKTVRALFPLGNNELWICTYEAGFYLFKNGKIRQFPADRNNYLNAAHCILEDHKGWLWISTNNGIFTASKKDLLSYREEVAPNPYYLHYKAESGFISNEFNGGDDRMGLKLPNGAFCYSSMKGWVFFFPDSIKGDFPDKALIIDRIEAGNTELPLSGSVVLEHAFDPVTITVATAYFGNPENLQYDYRFDEGKWIVLKNNQVTFNALSSGNHLLTIRKRSGFGNQYLSQALKIEVAPAWWETWVFRIAVMLVITLLLWLAFRLRFYLLKRRNKHLEEAVAIKTQQLKENITALEQSEEKLTQENKFQQRLTNHIAHDIRTPLKYLTFSSKHLYNTMKQKEAPEENDAREVYRASEQIFQFTGRLISYLNAWTVTNQPREYVDIAWLVEQKFDIFSLAAKEQDIKLVNLVPHDQPVLSHGILMDILLHNLLDNSIKHTTGGTVTFSFEARGDEAVIVLTDTGKGIREEEMQAYNEYLNDEYKHQNGTYTGLGFSIIKNILPLINAGLVMFKNKPKGTTITLILRAAFK